MIPDPVSVGVLTPEAAAKRLHSDSVLLVSGLVGSLVPEQTLRAVRERFDATGDPRGLTAIFPVAVGDVYDAPGLDHLAQPDILKSVIGGSYVYGRSPVTGMEPALARMVIQDRIHAYNFPIGVMFGALRERAAGRPGLITKVGVGTFQDPRVRGGRLNESTPAGYVTVIQLDGNDYLRYRLPPVDMAVLRGSTADLYGNVSMEREVVRGGAFVEALCAHNSGGLVIVEVERLAEGGSLDPRTVTIPGKLVDFLVVVREGQQATRTKYDPYLSGELRAPETRAESLEPVEEVILEKVAERLRTGDLVILGFGIPSKLPSLSSLPQGIRFTVEHGAIGGQPSGGLVFGGAINAEAVIDTPSMFDLIDGGGCDAACLGFAQVEPDGSVNVSRLPNALPGSGGFTNITAATKRLFFCGSFTAGGLKVERNDEHIQIVEEGRFRKFVMQAHEVTFRAGLHDDQEVIFVTDRCVLERRTGRLVVTEIYPGVDVDRDIRRQSDFPLEVSLEGSH